MMVRKYEHTSGKIEAQSNQASGVTGTILKFTIYNFTIYKHPFNIDYIKSKLGIWLLVVAL